ncbi:hypothetical protein YC2023_113829 [Brassica napus]
MSVLSVRKSPLREFSTKSSYFLEHAWDSNMICCSLPSIIMPSRSSVFCLHFWWKIIFSKDCSFFIDHLCHYRSFHPALIFDHLLQMMHITLKNIHPSVLHRTTKFQFSCEMNSKMFHYIKE